MGVLHVVVLSQIYLLAANLLRQQGASNQYLTLHLTHDVTLKTNLSWQSTGNTGSHAIRWMGEYPRQTDNCFKQRSVTVMQQLRDFLSSFLSAENDKLWHCGDESRINRDNNGKLVSKETPLLPTKRDKSEWFINHREAPSSEDSAPCRVTHRRRCQEDTVVEAARYRVTTLQHLWSYDLMALYKSVYYYYY